MDRPYTRCQNIRILAGNHPTFGQAAYSWIKKAKAATSEQFVASSLTIYESHVGMAGLAGKNLKDKIFVQTVVGLWLLCRAKMKFVPELQAIILVHLTFPEYGHKKQNGLLGKSYSVRPR